MPGCLLLDQEFETRLVRLEEETLRVLIKLRVFGKSRRDEVIEGFSQYKDLAQVREVAEKVPLRISWVFNGARRTLTGPQHVRGDQAMPGFGPHVQLSRGFTDPKPRPL